MTRPENDPITLSNNLLHSLLDQQIPLIQSFKGKWSLIKSKLADLQAQLNDFSELQTSITNSLSLDLLHSISQTLNDAHLLAEKCLDTNLTEGKLKTQSDIDSILAKLNQNVKDCEVLIKSGVLQDGILSGSGSKRELVRAEFRNLITRLQIGSTESKNAAMDTVLSLIQEDDKNVMIAVAQGFLNQEVGLLKKKLVLHFKRLSFSRENARAIGSRGGICSLLEICQAGTPSSQGLASGVLRNLALFEEIRENFIEENAVFVLIGLAASGTALAQENAIGCLCNLVKEDENLKILIVKEGVIEWSWATSQAIAEGLVSDGFVVRLVAVLSCGVMGVRSAAARAVYELGFNMKTRKLIGELGCISPLIKMLDGKAVEEKEAAAKALSLLVLHAGNRSIFRKTEGGIVSTVQLLDPSIQNLDKKYPVSILASILNSKKCRKQMIAAGASVHLKKLMEMDVEGSKKLLDGLGRGKIWGVFARP
ncbi:hypothetical protein OIU84_007266 [Salix udensis]|uniref:DUF7032 domain-containing protein n=1 Tax=Salix udensis TaxID=889485 RepID=A0AAD6NZA4_9ROSI|nr:hypothetical protein OIU84_007266 [Salix udensis]